MDNFTINVNQICSIRTRPFRINPWYVYKKGWYLWPFVKLEGFYYDGIRPTFTEISEIEKDGNLICKDKEVFYKPCVEIRLSDRTLHIKWFNTEKEMLEFANSDELKQLTWIDGDKLQ